jgi:hypothetical protein
MMAISYSAVGFIFGAVVVMRLHLPLSSLTQQTTEKQ